MDPDACLEAILTAVDEIIAETEIDDGGVSDMGYDLATRVQALHGWI